MSANADQAKDTIRKLLNLARNDGATDGEIDNALRFAQRLMSAHHLSEEDLTTEPEDQYDAIDEAECGQVYTGLGARIHLWESRLARFAAQFVGGVNYFSDPTPVVQRNALGIATAGGSLGRRMCFYGLSEDAQLAAELYDDLRLTIIAMAKLKFGGCYRGEGGVYSEGFVDGLFGRMFDEQKRERAEAQKLIESGQSTALILVERRGDLIARKEERAKKWLKNEVGIRLVSGSGRSGANGSSSARSEGVSDGRKVSPAVTRTNRLCGGAR